MKSLQAVDSGLFFSRQDPRDPRLGDLVKQPNGSETALPLASPNSCVAIMGYPDDEGIRNNGGRVGAAEGPDEIRRWLYRMTPHPQQTARPLVDLGNLKTADGLEDRHQTAIANADEVFKSKARLLSFGGGNDYAYCDGLAFLRAHQDSKPLIVNVDAHLDVRDLSKGITSGTPFYRLLESEFKFDFVELGIQTQCNSLTHWEYVKKKGGYIISTEEVSDSAQSWLSYTVSTLGDLLIRRRPTFLAIDVDAFAWPYAVGVSQSWPLGLTPHEFWPLYRFFLKRMDVRCVGLYEVSPPLDINSGTAKLAAQLAHGFLHDV